MADISAFVRTDFKAVDKREALHSVKGFLVGDTSKVPIILDDGKAVGIVNDRAIMGRSLDPNAHIAQFTLHTRAITAQTSVADARQRMAEHRAAYLPVADAKGKPIGYVRAIDLARESLNGERARDLAVSVTQLQESSTLGEALHAFQKEYVEYLPVMRPDGRVSGVMRRSDMLKLEFNAGDKGRKDAGGEKIHFLNDAVGGFVDNRAQMLPPETGSEAVLETLDDNGFALVGSRDGRFMGLVTPETLFRVNGQ